MSESDNTNVYTPSGAESLTSNNEKPLMQLFEYLIGNDNKHNTVLTNAQILDILQVEFDIDIIELHDLEMEIYVNIVKRFLKDWPQWDEFERIMKELKAQGNKKMIKQLLLDKHTSLKNYLKLMLETCKPMAKETTNNVMELTAGKINKPKIDTSDIVMEVQCSRAQLNQLFFRKPHPGLHNTIFNISDNEQSRIIVNSLALPSMLNWWNGKLSVTVRGFSYSREVVHNLKHVLINKKLEQPNTECNMLNQDLEVQERKSQVKISKIHILQFLNSYLENRKNIFLPSGMSSMLDTYTTILGIIQKDLDYLPDELDVPGMYRRYASKYKYRRYLYKDVTSDTDDTKYDLCLEETLSPMYKYNIVKIDIEATQRILPCEKLIFCIECGLCSQKFQGLQPIDLLKDHFMNHQSEPDWQCTNCKVVLSMALLSTQNWTHVCVTP